VLVDFLGAGFSDAPEAFSYSLEDHARTVAALLDRLGLAASMVVA
jgi:pimeloyl-ACP methyl ester carboxylesterase